MGVAGGVSWNLFGHLWPVLCNIFHYRYPGPRVFLAFGGAESANFASPARSRLRERENLRDQGVIQMNE